MILDWRSDNGIPDLFDISWIVLFPSDRFKIQKIANSILLCFMVLSCPPIWWYIPLLPNWGSHLGFKLRYFSEYDFLFTGKEELDITSEDSISNLFSTQRFDYCINAAAYTHVEKAETNKKQAFLVNAKGAKYLAKQCNNNNTVLLQISTDYVFDGKKGTPYTEEDQTNPINVYGASKLEGEKLVKQFSEKYYIVRTSWLYSNYGHNFYNSITRFAKEGRDLKITTEQTGTPTNALDLSKAILKIISFNSNKDAN